MELKDLKIGQWYRCTAYPNHPFIPLETDKRVITKSGYFNGKPGYFEQRISNERFWYTAHEISFDDLPEDYKVSVPEEYKKPKEYQPLIFN